MATITEEDTHNMIHLRMISFSVVFHSFSVILKKFSENFSAEVHLMRFFNKSILDTVDVIKMAMQEVVDIIIIDHHIRKMLCRHF